MEYKLPKISLETIGKIDSVDWKERPIDDILRALSKLLKEKNFEIFGLWVLLIRHDSARDNADHRLASCVRWRILGRYIKGKLTDEGLTLINAVYQKVEALHPKQFYFPEMIRILSGVHIGREDIKLVIHFAEIEALTLAKKAIQVSRMIMLMVEKKAIIRSKYGVHDPLDSLAAVLSKYFPDVEDLKWERIWLNSARLCHSPDMRDGYCRASWMLLDGFREDEIVAVEKNLGNPENPLSPKEKSGLRKFFAAKNVYDKILNALEAARGAMAASLRDANEENTTL